MSPYYECPRFEKCNVNKCPLDPDIDLRNSVKTDEKCTMEKQVRYKIGKKYPNLLKYQGLTKREWAGKQMSQGERDRRRELFLTTRSKWQKSTKSPIVGVVANLNITIICLSFICSVCRASV